MALMGVLDGQGECFRQFGGVTRCLGPALEMVLETLPSQKFHDEIRLTQVFADIVDLDDVGMLEPGKHLGLATKPREPLRPVTAARVDHFERTSRFSPRCRAL